MTTVPLYSVTYRGADGVVVELFGTEARARARARQITGRVVIAEHGMRVGR